MADNKDYVIVSTILALLDKSYGILCQAANTEYTQLRWENGKTIDHGSNHADDQSTVTTFADINLCKELALALFVT